MDSETGDDYWPEPLKIDEGISSVAVGFQDLVILFTGGTNLTAYNVATKARAWQAKFTTTDSTSTPVLYGDTIYVNSGNFLDAVRAYSGTGKFEVPLDQSNTFPPVVSANSIVEITRDGKLLSLDLSGRKLFPQPMTLTSPPVVQPTPLGDYIMVPGGNGSLNLINSHTGESKWSFVMKPIAKVRTSSNPIANAGGITYVDFIAASAPAALANNTLLVLAKDGSLLAFDKSMGVDLTPPAAKLVFPNPGDQVSGQPPLTMAFTINDEASGVDEKSVSIEIDGKPVEFEKNKEHFYLVRVSSAGKVKPLPDGRHVLTVKATDWLGNQGSKDFILVVDNSLRPVHIPGSITSGGIGGVGGGSGGGSGGGGGGGGGRGGGV